MRVVDEGGGGGWRVGEEEGGGGGGRWMRVVEIGRASCRESG